MNNLLPLMLMNLPDITEFIDNPMQVITQVLTSSFGVFGYILVMFCLLVIVWSYTKNAFSMGIFIVLYGVVADVLYPAPFIIFVNVIGIGLIFGGVLFKGVFSDE